MAASRSLRPGDRVLTVTSPETGAPHRAISRAVPSQVREVLYAYPAGNEGMARTFIEFTDGTSGEFPTGADWFME
jgi:hypothetical protein